MKFGQNTKTQNNVGNRGVLKYKESKNWEGQKMPNLDYQKWLPQIWKQERLTGFEAEFKFHPTRKWRFDWAWPDIKLALECEGSVWANGRHTRGSGYLKDLEKYNMAIEYGWSVLRYDTETVQDLSFLPQLKFVYNRRKDEKNKS